ncbi:TrkH family potassium uptake protein [Hirschia baltica]|uniref:Trk system potassium uptake protein n=1 Tax=Hirschia baltica (strain ATCC 49814 / DSM 5838 / IFAM 1418) TaxID=582402 RepID=C6XMA6_HIRBI|nr:TrkH family potassium uptake protein [Hirschia baltica]ACT58049.1 cation transporter [Hirschia baltica ATCC 49814]
MKLRPLLYAMGLMTLGLGLFMLPCVVADLEADRDEWRIFFLLSIASITLGGVMALSARVEKVPIRTHDAFVLTVLLWVVLVFVASGPFFIGFGMSFTDAVFESMSGLTTTGATIMTGIENYPPSLHLWRSLLHWIGGIGIIVTAIAILPSLRLGGMQLFHLESSDTSEKFLPRIGEIALQTTYVYLGLTVICAGLYRLTGMSGFVSITMAMSTVSTGGFAVTDASFAPYVEGHADIVAMIFMSICSMPFALMVIALHGKWKLVIKDPQPLVWCCFAIAGSVIMAMYIAYHQEVEVGPEGTLRMVAFNVISILSGTGFGTEDFNTWGPFPATIFILMMFLGGTAGSASCGLKTFRVHIAFKAMISYTKQMIRPNQISPVRYAGKRVEETTLQSIMIFVFLFLASFAVLTCGLAMTGLDPLTAISAAAATICNVGPGLGEIVGPAGTFQPLPDAAKWMCITAMLLGRLELISIFVILSPSFWRN